MKHVFFFLMFALFVNAATSEEVSTCFSGPFQTLIVDETLWKLQDNRKNWVAFEFVDDMDVEFTLVRGAPLKKDPTAGALFAQIENAKGDLSKVSLLRKSFPEMDVDDLLVDNWSKSIVKGIDCVKLYHFVKVEHEVYTSPKESPFCYETQNRALSYLFVIDNRVHIIDFESPQEKFLELEPLFETTLQNLWME